MAKGILLVAFDYTKAQADEWIDEISDLLSPSPRPMTWIDADVDDDDYRE